MKIANITGYKFTPIEDEIYLKETILRRSIDLNLKGTVLISSKGLNFSVSGTKNNIDKFYNNGIKCITKCEGNTYFY